MLNNNHGIPDIAGDRKAFLLIFHYHFDANRLTAHPKRKLRRKALILFASQDEFSAPRLRKECLRRGQASNSSIRRPPETANGLKLPVKSFLRFFCSISLNSRFAKNNFALFTENFVTLIFQSRLFYSQNFRFQTIPVTARTLQNPHVLLNFFTDIIGFGSKYLRSKFGITPSKAVE